MPLLWLSLAFLAGIVLADLVVQPTLVWIGLGIGTLLVWVLGRNLTRRPGMRQTQNRFGQGELIARFREVTKKVPLPLSVLLVAAFAGAARFQAAQPKITADSVAWYNDSEEVVFS